MRDSAGLAHPMTRTLKHAAQMGSLWSEARYAYSKFRPRYGMADMGCSSKKLFRLIRRQYRTEPVIDINPTHRSLLADEAGLVQDYGVESALQATHRGREGFLPSQGGALPRQHQSAEMAEGYGAFVLVSDCDAGGGTIESWSCIHSMGHLLRSRGRRARSKLWTSPCNGVLNDIPIVSAKPSSIKK